MTGINEVEEIYKPKEGSDLELKPCPFCGNKEIVYGKYRMKGFPENNRDGDRWLAFCTNCLAEIDSGWTTQKSDVRDMWNKRA